MSDAGPISLAFLELQPKAAAQLLQEYPPEQVVEYFQQLSSSVASPVIQSMVSWPASRVLSLLFPELAADILRTLPTTEAETLLRLMDAGQRKEILLLMPDAIAKGFELKLTYPVSTVGAWMDTSIPCFMIDNSVNDSLDIVKRQKSHLGGVLIVVGHRRQLVGLVEMDKLLTSEGEQQLVDLLDRDVEPLSARATLWEVEHHDGWTRYPTLPVVDHNNTLLGALTHSALKAGSHKSGDLQAGHQRFSLIAHLSKAIFVTLDGLLQVISGAQAETTKKREARK